MPTIAMVYTKHASTQRSGMDVIRWTELGRRFLDFGYQVHLVTDRPASMRTLAGLPLLDSARVSWDQYDVIKVCYPHSIDLVPPHPTIIVRMCRVTDAERPARDTPRRDEILRQQHRVSELARCVAVNGQQDAERWQERYGAAQDVLIVPTGCPETIPKPGLSPFPPDRRIVLFCGSLTSPRFVTVLNQVAANLKRRSSDLEVHFIGRNRLHLYGNPGATLDPRLVHIHPAVDETEAWQYILHAHAGLALAPAGEAFESELAKIYYYLRGGLPVVTESAVLNRFLIEETGHGAVAAFGNLEELAEKVVAALEMPSRDRRVMNSMAETHSWRRRAEVYVNALSRWKEAPVEETIP